MPLSTPGWNELLRQQASGAPIGAGTVIKNAPVAPRPPLPSSPPSYNPYPSYGTAPRATDPYGPRASEFYGRDSNGNRLPSVGRGPTYAPPGTSPPFRLPSLPRPQSAMAQLEAQAAQVGVGAGAKGGKGLPPGTSKPTGAGMTAGSNYGAGLGAGLVGAAASVVTAPLVNAAGSALGDALIDAFGGGEPKNINSFCQQYPGSKQCEGWSPPPNTEDVAGGAVTGVAPVGLQVGLRITSTYPGRRCVNDNPAAGFGDVFTREYGPFNGPTSNFRTQVNEQQSCTSTQNPRPRGYDWLIDDAQGNTILVRSYLTGFPTTVYMSNDGNPSVEQFVWGTGENVNPQVIPSKAPNPSPSITNPPGARAGAVPPILPAPASPTLPTPATTPTTSGDAPPSLSPAPLPGTTPVTVDDGVASGEPEVASPENVPKPKLPPSPGSNPTTTPDDGDESTESSGNPLGGLPGFIPPLIMPSLPTTGSTVENGAATTPGEQTKPKPQPVSSPLPGSAPKTGCGCNAPILNSIEQLKQDLKVPENAGNAAIMAQLQFMQGWQVTAWGNTVIDKAINAMNLIGIIHNAYYLSNGVALTIGEMASLLLSMLGVKDATGSPIDVNALIANEIYQVLSAAFGEENLQDLQATIAKASRIYQAANNVFYGLTSLQNSVADVLEVTAENTGRIGNALKKSGVVDALSYPYMSEAFSVNDAMRNRYQRIFDGIEQVDNTANSLYAVVAGVQDVTEQVNQINSNKTAFLNELNLGEPTPPITNQHITTVVEQSKLDSSSPDLEGTPIDAASEL